VERLFPVCGSLTAGKRNGMDKLLNMRAWLKVNRDELLYGVGDFVLDLQNFIVELSVLFTGLNSTKHRAVVAVTDTQWHECIRNLPAFYSLGYSVSRRSHMCDEIQ